ncbi:MAG TPA: hypothetical protein VIF62_17035 [Labilithrix sp.]
MTSVSPAARWGALGALAFLAFSAWEIATPRLPVRFETASAPLWEARLGMAFAAALGIGAVVVLLARTVDRRAAAYAAAILATTPAWFVHGRTSTGVILPMAAEAMVLAGAGVALLAEDARRSSRALAALVASAGALLAAYAHALFVAAAPPLLAVGVAAALARAAVRATATSTATSTATATAQHAMTIGAARATPTATSIAAAIGFAPCAAITFGLATTAFAAIAIGRGWGSAIVEAVVGARAAATRATFEAPVAAVAYACLPWTPLLVVALGSRPRDVTHRAIVLCAALAMGAHALLAPRVGPAAFVGVAPVACAIALALHRLEERRHASVAMVLAIAAAALLVARDVELAPERVAAALAPGSVDPAAGSTLAVIGKTVAGATTLAAALAVTALAVPRTWLPTSRSLVLLFAGVLAGLVLRAYAYPSLLARLSPGEAFETWARVHRDGEKLAVLGVDTRAFAGLDVAPQRSADLAGAWLAGGASAPRRWLAMSATELPRVNAAYRAARGHNVPILAGKNGSVLLGVSALAPGEIADGPLDRIVLDAPPSGLRSMDAVLGDRLEALGWTLEDDDGAPLAAARTGSRAHVRVAIRVRAAIESGAYCTFLHVDHQPTRFAAEHRTHAYPMPLWRAGDIVVDDFEVVVPASVGSGAHPLYWGVGVLPCHDDARMPVTSGRDDGHGRIPGGTLEVK